MSLDKRLSEQSNRLKKMGYTLLAFAISCSSLMYLLPTDETHYWLSTTSKEGIYVLSLFFGFLGLYCLGAIWRRRHFI